eukprot:255798_1
MEELIKFRSQIDLLNNKEFITFIQSFQRENVTNLFFGYFRYQLINTTNYQQWQQEVLPNIHIMICQIQKIIDSRSKLVQDEQQNNINLDDLPLVMISSISSFLDLKDTLKFEKTNRNIFIGTRSPISRQSLDAKPFTHCLSYSNAHSFTYNFYRFRCVQQLTIDTNDMMYEFYDYDEAREGFKEKENCYVDDINMLPIWDRLTTLSLINNEHVQYDDVPPIFDMLSDSIFDNITTLTWHANEDLRAESEMSEIAIIDNNMFPSLRYLHLECFLNSDFMFDSSALKGLSITYSQREFCQGFIHRACNTLESLHLKSFSSDVLRLFSKQNKFVCLKELCINQQTQTDIGFVNEVHAQNVSNLQRFHCTIPHGMKSKDELKALMHLLLSVRSLNYVSVHCEYDMLLNTFQIIQSALNGQVQQNKDSIKIEIVCDKRFKAASGEEAKMQSNIVDLVRILDRISKHFMLICRIYRISKGVLKHKDQLDKNGAYLFQTHGKHKVCISNRKCNINGYHEKWIMNCCCCNGLQ